MCQNIHTAVGIVVIGLLVFQIAQNGALSDFFESFGGQLEDVNFTDSFVSAEAPASFPTASVATVLQPAAIQNINAGISYQGITTVSSQGNRVVALNVPAAQSTGAVATVSQQLVYYNGLG